MTPSPEALAELARCPFCGGEARSENFIVEAVVRCTNCRATITRRHDPDDDCGVRYSIAAWNTRPQSHAAGVDEAAVVAACRAYNAVLLNQPEDNRDQPEAMRAALDAILALLPQPSPEGEWIGPRPRPHLFVCKGCPAYETENWHEPSGDGETYDTGQYAWCNAAGRRSMGAYHYDHTARPDWCPALPPPPASTAMGE